MIIPRIYLIGGMETATDGGEGWRKTAEDALQQMGYGVYNPCTDEVPLLAPHGIASSKDLVNLKYTDLDKYLICIEKIIDYDLDILLDCDAALAYIDNTAIGGASGELTMAKWYGIPVISFLDKSNLKGIPGWNLGCAGVMLPSLEQALQYIKDNPIQKRTK